MFGLWFPVSSACPSLLSLWSGSPCALRTSGTGGEQFLAAAVSCRPLSQFLGQGRSLIYLQDAAQVMTWVTVWALQGTAVEKEAAVCPLQLLRGMSSAPPLCSASTGSALRKGCASRDGALWSLSHSSVLLEGVLKKRAADSLELSPRWRLGQGCVSPPQWVVAAICGTAPNPVSPPWLSSDGFTHVLLLSSGSVPLKPRGMGLESRTGMI